MTPAEKKALVERESRTTLDRTTAGILYGDVRTPEKQLNAEQRLMLEKARVREEWSKGTISNDQALARLGLAGQNWEQQANERTQRLGEKAYRAGKSERVNQDTARAVASQQGIAVGTINENKAATSQNSQVSSNVKVNNFIQAQKQPSTQAQRDSRVKVTTPDGKERTFKDRETADKFVSRTEGSYVKEIQRPVKPNYNYQVTLSENKKKDESFNSPYGNLDFTYGQQELSNTGKVLQPAINFLDDYTQQKPKNVLDSLVMQFTQPVAGGLKQGAALVGSLDNLGHLLNSWRTGEPQKEKNIEIKPTVDQPAITALLEGKSADEFFKSYKEYFGTYNIESIKGELVTFGVGAKGSKNLVKLFPVRGEKYSQPGVKIVQSQKTFSKTAINTPVITTKEVSVKSFSLGYGSRTKPIISKVGNKINLGSPNLDNTTVHIQAVTKKQLQRGVKFAADSTKYEQDVNAKLIDKVFNITQESKDLAKTEKELVDILTTPKKDTVINKQLGSGVFENVTPTEQSSFTRAISKAQRKILDPIGKYEGSLSGYYFTAKQYLRTLGDVDLHADTFSKAAKQMRGITPEVKPDTGRFYFNKISEKNKSVKQNVFDSKTGKSEKTIEILNPEETDELGVLQSIEGDTLFGQKIPTKSYKVKEGKTYGRQRQILKKMESLYSLQKDPITGQVKLRPYEKRYKDVADTYALGRSAQQVEFTKGTPEYERLDYLLDKFKAHFKTHENFDIDNYLKKNGISKDATLKTDKSILQNLGSNTGKSLTEASKNIPESSLLSKTRPPKEEKELSLNSNDQKKIPSLYNQRNSLYNRGSIIERSITQSLSNTIKPLSLTGKYTPPKSIKPRSLSNYSPPKTRSPPKTNSPPFTKYGNSLNSPTPTKSPPFTKSLGRSLGQNKGGIERSLLGRPSPTMRGLSDTYTKKRQYVPYVPINILNTTKQPKGTKKESHNFLAWTNVSSVLGVRTTKKDIDVGDKKTEKLYRENILKTKKKYSKSDKKNSKNLLGSNKKNSKGLF